jgi:hypothetical protein
MYPQTLPLFEEADEIPTWCHDKISGVQGDPDQEELLQFRLSEEYLKRQKDEQKAKRIAQRKMLGVTNKDYAEMALAMDRRRQEMIEKQKHNEWVEKVAPRIVSKPKSRDELTNQQQQQQQPRVSNSEIDPLAERKHNLDMETRKMVAESSLQKRKRNWYIIFAILVCLVAIVGWGWSVQSQHRLRK